MNERDVAILHSCMLVNTVTGPLSQCATIQPTNEDPVFIPSLEPEQNELFRLIKHATIQSFWKAHSAVDEYCGPLQEKETGNGPLHLVVLSMHQLCMNSVSVANSSPEPNNRQTPNHSDWEAAAVSLIYRLTILGKCSINAVNKTGNTALHLACMRPDASGLVRHLVRLGADPQLANDSNVRVYYDFFQHQGALVKGFPGLQCGLWDAVKREDMECVKQYLQMWGRTVCTQPTGENLYEVAMATGVYDVVRAVNQMRTTNELVCASLALDLDYMEQLLSARPEHDKCKLDSVDISFQPPRPLIGELHMVLGYRAAPAIELIRRHCDLDETVYYNQLKFELTAFDHCPFVTTVQNASSRADISHAWDLTESPSFKVYRRRSSDGSTYLHFLVHQYLQNYERPHIQRALVRLMYQVALLGVDVQARDNFGRTALVLATETHGKFVPTDEVDDDDVVDARGKRLSIVPKNTPVLRPSTRDTSNHNTSTDEHLLNSDHLNKRVETDQSTFDQDKESPISSRSLEKPMVTLDECGPGTEKENRLDRFLSQRGSIMFFMEEQEQIKRARESVKLLKIQKEMELAVENVLKKKERRGRIFCGLQYPDQNLIAVLIQLGVDSTLCDPSNKTVQCEPYLPRDVLLLKNKSDQGDQLAQIDERPYLLGIWPVLDNVLHKFIHRLVPFDLDSERRRLLRAVGTNLTNIRARRFGLTVTDLVQSLCSIRQTCGNSSSAATSNESITDTPIRSQPFISSVQISEGVLSRILASMLREHTGVADFAMAALSGDERRMKHCLAMGNSISKVTSHFRKHFYEISKDGRAIYVSRPLLVSVMEYSTSAAVELMLTYGASLAEFYCAPNSFGPVAFWAFRDLIPLRTTKIIADRAPVSLRDKNGATLLHHTIHLFHRLNPSDQNGHRWASLILLTLLNRGVDIAVRDCWGRTARDLCQSGCQKALCASLKHTMATNVDDNPEEYRDFEETTPDLYELRELIHPVTQKLISPQEIIDRRVAQLVSMDQVSAIELLIVHGYDALQQACMGFPKSRSACEIAASKGYLEMVGVLNGATARHMDVLDLQRAICEEDDKTFSRLVPEGVLIWSLDWRRRSLLHLAVLHGRVSMALRIIDLCPQLVESQDCLGRTPLHYAICLSDNHGLFFKLVAQLNGVDKGMKDFNEITIANYGESFELGLPEFRQLVPNEKQFATPVWLQTSGSFGSISVNSRERSKDESGELKANDSTGRLSEFHSPNACSATETALVGAVVSPYAHPLAFPTPGAFSMAQLNKIRTTVK